MCEYESEPNTGFHLILVILDVQISLTSSANNAATVLAQRGFTVGLEKLKTKWVSSTYPTRFKKNYSELWLLFLSRCIGITNNDLWLTKERK